MWDCLDTGKNSASENMALDARLLEELNPSGAPLLHLYDWEESSATYGYFLKFEEHLKGKELDFARRPTGGGVIFHLTDLAFSALIPAHLASNDTLSNYQYINDRVKLAVKKLLEERFSPDLLATDPPKEEGSSSHFCMAKPTIYDVMIGEKKVAGAAQRQRKQGILHQGSISLALPRREEIVPHLAHPEVYEAMLETTFAPLKGDYVQSELQDLREEMKTRLKEEFIHV